jgi:MFS family permease
MAVIGTFAYEFQVSLPLLAQRTFLGDATAYAALFAAFGSGSAFGGIYSAGRSEISPRHFLVAITLFGVSIIITSLAPTLLLAIIGIAIVGAFSINVISLGNSTVQIATASNMRGRVLSLWAMAMIGSTTVGGPIVGWVGEHAGARWGLAIGGVATLMTAYFAYRQLKNKSDSDETLPPSVENSSVTIENLKLR